MEVTFTQTGAYRMFNALQVIVLTPAIRAWLETNDPKALQQALTALETAIKE